MACVRDRSLPPAGAPGAAEAPSLGAPGVPAVAGADGFVSDSVAAGLQAASEATRKRAAVGGEAACYHGDAPGSGADTAS